MNGPAKGTVNTVNDLNYIPNLKIGDSYTVAESGHLYVYNGTTFIDTGEIKDETGVKYIYGYYQEQCPNQPQFKKTKEEELDFNNSMINLCKEAPRIKWKTVFALALALILLFAIGDYPNSIVGWQAFCDLVIEYICNILQL